MELANAPAPEAPEAAAADEGAAGSEKKAPGRKSAPPKVPYLAEGAAKLTAVPEDYSASKHLPLKKDDFEADEFWFDYKAEGAEAQAKAYRVKAETARKFGNAEQRKAADRLAKMAERMEKMKAELAAELGEDVLAEVESRLASVSAEG